MGLLTNYWSIDFVITIGSLFFLVYSYMTRNFQYWKKRGVVEVEPTPFIGNLGECLRLQKSVGESLQSLYNRGAGLPYMGFYVFDRPFLLIRDPELIKAILIKDFNYFQDRFSQTSPDDPLGYANIFFLRNPAWRYLRTNLTPIYSPGKLKKMFNLLPEVVEDLYVHMESLFRDEDDPVIEVKELSARYTTDVIGTTAFGLKVNSLLYPDAEFRKHGQDILEFTFYKSISFTSIFFAPQLAKRFDLRLFSPENSNFLRTTVWNTIKERERTGISRGDLIDMLLELKKMQADSPEKEVFDMDGDNLVAQAALFFLAGFESSATTLSFSLYELALHPEIQLKARNEILKALKENDGNITYEMVMNTPYLEMVVFETLRKYPPLSLLDRLAGQDYKIPNSDLILEKGTPVYISLVGLHYDPQYFPDPEKYDPERFTLENKKTRPSSVYLPFGDGPHACIGLRLGMLQVKIGLIALLQKYEFSSCNQTSIPLRMNRKSFVTAADGGIFLKFRRIEAEL